MRYCGGPLVEPASFLRQLPVCVPDDVRIIFDAIVVASDVIAQAFSVLRTSACQIDIEKDLEDIIRARLIGQCWAIIDQLHTIRQLVTLQAGKELGPKTEAFLEISSTVHKLRNKMDHLRTNIGNLSKQKGALIPIFGVVSYIYTTDSSGKNILCVSAMAGSLHGEDSIPMVDPTDRVMYPPVDHFQLYAFGEKFEIEPSLTSFRDLIADVSAAFKIDVEFQAKRRAEVSEDKLEDLMAKRAVGLRIILNYKKCE